MISTTYAYVIQMLIFCIGYFILFEFSVVSISILGSLLILIALLNFVSIKVDEKEIELYYFLLGLRISYLKEEVKYINFRYTTSETEPGVLISIIKSDRKNVVSRIIYNSFYGVRVNYKKARVLWVYMSEKGYLVKEEKDSIW